MDRAAWRPERRPRPNTEIALEQTKASTANLQCRLRHASMASAVAVHAATRAKSFHRRERHREVLAVDVRHALPIDGIAMNISLSSPPQLPGEAPGARWRSCAARRDPVPRLSAQRPSAPYPSQSPRLARQRVEARSRQAHRRRQSHRVARWGRPEVAAVRWFLALFRDGVTRG